MVAIRIFNDLASRRNTKIGLNLINVTMPLVQLGEQLNTESAPAKAASILDYLENQLPLHLADEEEDLFPLLKQRSPSDDGMISVLNLLCIEHRHDVECGRSLIEALRRIARGG